ncbi:MAG: response regulator [Proteobacteria bacterium]|jgi:two-component system, OmpR family, phosphate regulon response regulator PhoB|nr:response regulator [Pseudomonadota bacterium]
MANKKILVVDDEPSVRTYLETLLEDNGYDVVNAVDGVDGLTKALSEKPDLITLDISMPKQSGVRMYRELKNSPDTNSIPVIIVTAVTGYANKPEYFKKFLSTRKSVPPPDGFIAKPIDRDELVKTVGDLLK